MLDISILFNKFNEKSHFGNSKIPKSVRYFKKSLFVEPILHIDASNNSITILKLNPRFSSGNCTSMVKVLSLDQKHYFLYVFQGRGETVVSRSFLHSLLPFSIVSLSCSHLAFFPALSFPPTFSRSLFPSQVRR